MSEEGGGAVTQQPRSKKRELEEFVRDLDPLQVQGGNFEHVQKRERDSCSTFSLLLACVCACVRVCVCASVKGTRSH